MKKNRTLILLVVIISAIFPLQVMNPILASEKIENKDSLMHHEIEFDLNNYEFETNEETKQITLLGLNQDIPLDLKSISKNKEVIVIPGEINGYQTYIKSSKLFDLLKINDNPIIGFDDNLPLYGIKFKQCNGKNVIVDINNTEYDNQFLTSLFVDGFYDISGLEFSDKITSLRGLFANSKAQNIIGLENINLSNITDIGRMFYNTPNLNGDVYNQLANWDTKNVIDMERIFNRSNLTGHFDALKNWDVNNLENMDSAFGWSDNLETLDISGWNTTKLKSFSHVFCNKNLIFVNAKNIKLDSTVNIDHPFGGEISDIPNLPDTNAGFNKELLFITTDEQLLNYNYLNDNRIPFIPTFNANGGVFTNQSDVFVPQNAKVAISKDDIEEVLEYVYTLAPIPTLTNQTFNGWEKITVTRSSNEDTLIDLVSGTYNAKWLVNNVNNEEVVQQPNNVELTISQPIHPTHQIPTGSKSAIIGLGCITIISVISLIMIKLHY